jgi:hypothetical protein
MFFNECDEIRGRVAGESGLREVLVRGDKVVRPAMDVGEIATASAGNQNFLADAIGALQHGNVASPFAGLYCTEQPGSPGAKNQSVKLVDQG